GGGHGSAPARPGRVYLRRAQRAPPARRGLAAADGERAADGRPLGRADRPAAVGRADLAAGHHAGAGHHPARPGDRLGQAGPPGAAENREVTRPPRSRRVLALAASLLAGLALLGAAWPWLGDGGARHETQAIARGDIQATVHALGRLEPITEVEVGVQVSGQIVRLLVQPGDTVQQGQLLAEIDA